MSLPTRVIVSPFVTRAAVLAAFAVLFVTAPAAQTGSPATQTPDKIVPTLAVSLLQPLLPEADGWTKGPVHSNRIAISDDCGYAYADAVYTSGERRVRVTVADSGFDPGGLAVLVPIVMTMPEGYSGKIPPATTVERLTFQGSPAAARWDGDKSEGDFEVLVAKRFVAKAEGTHVNTIDTVRGLVEKIDLKRLGALK